MSIEIKNFKELDDGSATFDFDYDKDFEIFLKEKFGWKRITKQRVRKYINTLLFEMANKAIRST